MFKLSDMKAVHIVGIGGISNSAIAQILHSKGYLVTGSDLNESHATQLLRDLGIPIAIGHHESNLSLGGKPPQLVAYTAAIDRKNPEIRMALEQGIPLCSRAELLGALMEKYPHSIAVSGSHGKTSTTSMIDHLLSDHHDTTTLFGGFIQTLGSNVKVGGGDILITEACEYKDSFLSFRPDIGVILNIEEDHLDYFSGIDQITQSFRTFAQSVRRLLVVNADDSHIRSLLQQSIDAQVITFSVDHDADYRIVDIEFDSSACAAFRLVGKDGSSVSLKLSVPGKHNVYNAAAAFCVSRAILGETANLAERLATFRNANRRFQHIGTFRGARIVDDYAHHPSEIVATIAAAKQMTDIHRLLIVFQPHTYTRTKQLLTEFGSSFVGADLVIVSDIYAAREPDLGEVHSRDLVRSIASHGVTARYGGDLESTARIVSDLLEPGDLVITMGAGDIDRVHRIWQNS